MRRYVAWRAEDSIPARDHILRLQGITPGQPLPPRLVALTEQATATFLELAEPRAIVADISVHDFAAVYRGEGRNAHETPLQRIFPRADRLSLAAATVGARATDRIRDLFERRDPALGYLLDTIASAAADRLADLLGPWYLATSANPSPDWRVLAYSPGYCGWDLTGQRALFDFLRPEEIGITLTPSCLMQPLKSISAVLVAGPGHVHRFDPAYSFCDRCHHKQCRDRIASLTPRAARRRS